MFFLEHDSQPLFLFSHRNALHIFTLIEISGAFVFPKARGNFCRQYSSTPLVCDPVRMLPVDRRIAFHGLHGNYVQRLCLPCGVSGTNILLNHSLRFWCVLRLQILHGGILCTDNSSCLLLWHTGSKYPDMFLRLAPGGVFVSFFSVVWDTSIHTLLYAFNLLSVLVHFCLEQFCPEFLFSQCCKTYTSHGTHFLIHNFRHILCCFLRLD